MPVKDTKYRLYAGSDIVSEHLSLEEAMERAKAYIPNESYIRIEEYSGDIDGNWWAYVHQLDSWERS